MLKYWERWVKAARKRARVVDLKDCQGVERCVGVGEWRWGLEG